MLETSQNWFSDFLERFYGIDKDQDKHIALKEVHSRNVATHMVELARSLHLRSRQKAVAEVTGLLHDVGRFVQYHDYRTFADAQSFNHARRSVKILQEHEALPHVPDRTQGDILWSIHHHNRRILPHTDSPIREGLARMLRDADKMDILRITSDHFTSDLPRGERTIELHLQTHPGVSDSVKRSILEHESVDKTELQTVDDFKVLQMALVFDLNFPAARRHVIRKGYIETICGTIKDQETAQTIRNELRKINLFGQDK